MNKTLWIILGVVVAVGLYSWGVYNSLVTASEAVDGAWAQVETQYQRRFDLIPNLVESVKGIFKQEKDVFNALAEARTRYAGAKTISDKVAATNAVEASFGRLLAVIENYPQLKSADTVQTLMVQLEGTENRVSVERSRFNDGVRDYNVRIKRFPASVLAGWFGFTDKAYFAASEEAKTAPKVGF